MCISRQDFTPQRKHYRENLTDFNVTKLIFQFSSDCFLPPLGRWGVYPNTLRAPPELLYVWRIRRIEGQRFSGLVLPLLHLSCFFSGVSYVSLVPFLSHTHTAQKSRTCCRQKKEKKNLNCPAGRWNRWVSCRSHIYENVLKWLGLNLSRPRGGQFKTYAFCTSIWLLWMTAALEVSLFRSRCWFSFFPRVAALRLDYS